MFSNIEFIQKRLVGCREIVIRHKLPKATNRFMHARNFKISGSFGLNKYKINTTNDPTVTIYTINNFK